MLKIVREMAVENPWVLRIVIGLIAVTFVVTMGWFGFQAPEGDRVAVVDGKEITAKEYRAAYNRAVEFYRQNYKDKFNSDLLRSLKVEDQVINELIERALWKHEAKIMGLEVRNEELSAAVTEIPNFQKEGKFDSNLYRQVLEANRTNPKVFEASVREDLLVDKVKRIVRDAVAVTDREVTETFPTFAAVSQTGQEKPPEEMERMKKFLLFQKQEKALKSYAEAMRQRSKISIDKRAL
jgi:peptidyl-prolyl cis-trans isomerase D